MRPPLMDTLIVPDLTAAHIAPLDTTVNPSRFAF
jgi:hypothetical protein